MHLFCLKNGHGLQAMARSAREEAAGWASRKEQRNPAKKDAVYSLGSGWRWVYKTAKLKEWPMSWFSVLLLAALGSACASTPVVDTNVKINFPPTAKIESVEQADAVLAAVTLSRAQVEWRYQKMEQICYTKFFTNSCLLDAKDERRIDLAKIKKSEVAANFFKRKHTVEEMDRELAEKNKQSLYR